MPSAKKKTAKKKTTARSSAKKSGPKNRWVATVKTDSTHPPEGLFTKGAASIAKALASKEVSPRGPASGMRMLTYYINRAGKSLTASDRTRLGKAKILLSKSVARERERRTA
jgi:tRNA(adenine34) deaminase